jgi:hypothetical protein
MDNSSEPDDGNTFWETCYFYTDKLRMTTGFPSNVYYINYVSVLIFNILLTVLTIFLNSVTILAYIRSTHLQTKKSYFLIMLLSVNDLLVGVLGNTSFILVLAMEIIGYPCKMWNLDCISICSVLHGCYEHNDAFWAKHWTLFIHLVSLLSPYESHQIKTTENGCGILVLQYINPTLIPICFWQNY